VGGASGVEDIRHGRRSSTSEKSAGYGKWAGSTRVVPVLFAVGDGTCVAWGSARAAASRFACRSYGADAGVSIASLERNGARAGAKPKVIYGSHLGSYDSARRRPSLSALRVSRTLEHLYIVAIDVIRVRFLADAPCLNVAALGSWSRNFVWLGLRLRTLGREQLRVVADRALVCELDVFLGFVKPCFPVSAAVAGVDYKREHRRPFSRPIFKSAFSATILRCFPVDGSRFVVKFFVPRS
jgi:hypothetical protein